MSWETTDVLSADTKALPPSANNKLGLLKTAHLGTIFEAWTLKNASLQGFPKWSPRCLAPHGGHPPSGLPHIGGGHPHFAIPETGPGPTWGGVTLPHVGQGFVLAPIWGPWAPLGLNLDSPGPPHLARGCPIGPVRYACPRWPCCMPRASN